MREVKPKRFTKGNLSKLESLGFCKVEGHDLYVWKHKGWRITTKTNIFTFQVNVTNDAEYSHWDIYKSFPPMLKFIEKEIKDLTKI